MAEIDTIRSNSDRLWASIMEIGDIGATPRGGVGRLALTELDRQARELFMSWCQQADCEVRVDQISWLMLRLSDAGFEGTVRIESHLGAFCLVSDTTGIYQLQNPEAPFTACSFIGHPLDGSRLLSDRQTSHFEFFRAASPVLADSGIELDVVVRDRSDSEPRVPYPANPQTAGDWNRIAAINNRLEYSLQPDETL